MVEEKIKQVYRLAPCPSYDVEGMECWLTELAEEGLILTKDGFWGGLAIFRREKPQQLKYRLEASLKGTSMWTENYGEPDSEAVELGQRYGWEYIAKRGDFYIYCSDRPGERELNTDPKVQALTLNAVRKRRVSALFTAVFWLLLYVFMQFYTGILLTMITARSWFFLWAAGLVLWFDIDSVREVMFLGRLQNRLKEEGMFTHTRDWRKYQKAHYCKHAIRLILAAAWLIVALQGWSRSTLEEDIQSISEYQGEIPFATMTDFIKGEIVSYRDFGMGKRFDGVKEWSDWLAPRNIKWSEHAHIRWIVSSEELEMDTDTVDDLEAGSDKQTFLSLDGGLTVEYHETANAWIARVLAKEYVRQDWFNKVFPRLGKIDRMEWLELPEADDLGVEYAVAYLDQFHFANAVLQKGNQVVHVQFYQTGEEERLPLEYWVRMMAESL